jgi:hypothetical protein
MPDNSEKPSVVRVKEFGGRDATVLKSGVLEVMIDDIAGAIPELSHVQGKGRVNAHWLPWFRSGSGKPYSEAEHGAFWKGSLLYHAAGSFPCAPNFGPGHVVDGIAMPPHGWTANGKWKFIGSGIDEETGAAWALTAMDSPEKSMPLRFRKIDLLLPDQPVHYASLEIENAGDRALEICCGWHNTLGSPFIQAGCLISAGADQWKVTPPGGEFDGTGRLAPGEEFSSLARAPLARGKETDISLIPGPIGCTDFVTGAIPGNARLGWSAVVNPGLKLLYCSFFTGPKAPDEDDIVLRFNNLWMQYGGRPFTPWAAYEGGADLTYCLGAENALSAYACGLEFSRQNKKILGAPATLNIPAKTKRTLRYGVLFAPWEGAALNEGLHSVEGDEKTLVFKGGTDSLRVRCDPLFSALKGMQGKLR